MCKKAIYKLEVDSFWYSVKNCESWGVEGTRKKPTMLRRTVNNPSYESVRFCKKLKIIPKRTRMKIQAHPGLPPMPFMFSIAAESNPEKVPDS